MIKSNFIFLRYCGCTAGEVSNLGLRAPAEVVSQPDAGVDLCLPLPPVAEGAGVELGLLPLVEGGAVLLVSH